jgi:hypothetical protein
MKPDHMQAWQTLAAAGRKKLDRDATSPEAEAIAWLPDLATQVHAGFLRQIWRRWTLFASLISVVIVGYFLLAERMASPGDDLPAPRIPIPAAP